MIYRTFAVSYCLFLVSSQLIAEKPTLQTSEIRTAIQNSIGYLEREGESWIEKRGCVSCHQVPFMVWSLDAASRHDFQVDEQNLALRKNWTTEIANFDNPNNQSDRSEAERAAANIDTMAQLLLALGNDPRVDTAGWTSKFEDYLIENQQPEGHWKPCGQLPAQKRPKPETQDVTTMWTLLSLMNTDDVDSLQTSLATSLEGLSKSGVSTEWWAVRLLLAQKLGDDRLVTASRDRLRKTQHDDGGWGWLVDDESDALGTGVALYALLKTGAGDDEQTISQAVAFLTRSQAEDGSWPVKSTKGKHQNQVTPTATYWGTAWAVIALCESLEIN